MCTDVTARGIDFPSVERVVNFDFPATSALYLHRAGRTARMGKAGSVTSLVHNSQRRFAESIRDAVERRAELHVVRKGDLRARSHGTVGKAHARATVGRETMRLRRRSKPRPQPAFGPAPPRGYTKPPPGTPGWRVKKWGLYKQ